MTHTEKILNTLEVNDNLPSLVVDEESNIVSCNKLWHDKVGISEIGKSFIRLFDKNNGLLIENSFVDSKIFQKVQRRTIEIKNNVIKGKVRLLISPFKIDEKPYYYVLIHTDEFLENYLIYPSVDVDNAEQKYGEIISTIKTSFPTSLIEKKNFQFSLDSEKVALGIKEKTRFSFTNASFNYNFNINDDKDSSENVRLKILEKIEQAENEVYISSSPFVIEHKDFVQTAIQLDGRIILYPILINDSIVDRIIVIGSIALKTSFEGEFEEQKPVGHTVIKPPDENLLIIANSDLAKLIYNKNNFDILDANLAAAELYGYSVDELKSMNITQLFPPEEMQKLLTPDEINGKFIFKQLKQDGSIIDVSIERENVIWDDDEACVETISINQPEEEVIKLNEYKEEPAQARPRVSLQKEQKVVNKKTKDKSDFLSTLFHELLTPVNVILGFVQEIIDSIETPTEEQEESAQIIKDNQQVLLQTMNTAVQYAQLEEEQIQFNSEKFDINKYLVDLSDSFSRLSEKENKNVIFDDIPNEITIQHDRAKLLAAISYFIKFALKLTDSSKIFVSFKIIEDKFYTFLSDSSDGISEIVLVDMLDIFNLSLVTNKKNYGISPITIKLSQTLNNLLSLSVVEHITDDGKKTIALVSPVTVKDLSIPSVTVPLLEDTETDNSQAEPLETVKIIHADKPILVPEDSLQEDIAETVEPIINNEIDEQIVEDIEDEEEIVTEEIATLEESITEHTSDLSNYSCLFIDDSVDTQLLFKSQMKDFKLLKVCSNLTEALPLLSKYNFDLVVVDINLNDTYNGFDALKIIRQFDNYQSTPIVAVTAYSFDGDKEKFINFGFTDYYVKPLLRNDLINSLESILQ